MTDLKKKILSKKGRNRISVLLCMVLCTGAFPATAWGADPEDGLTQGCKVVINEIESSDNADGADWIEIFNAGTETADIGGWYVSDGNGQERKTLGETTPLPEGTVMAPGAVFVLEEGVNFTFGLGKNDTAMLLDADDQTIDSYAYSGHAAGTYSRVPDGTGAFTDQNPTKGARNSTDSSSGQEENTGTGTETGSENSTGEALRVNEVNSSPDDWVELINTGSSDMDVSGFEIRDNSDDHRWQFPQDTVIKAGALYVVDAKTEGNVYDDQTGTYSAGTFEEAIGIGSGDSIRLYNGSGVLLDETSWTGHAAVNGDAALASTGRYPDGTGSFCLTKETKGQPNVWYAPSAVINEIESDGDAADWVEIKNTGDTELDISGWYIYDNDPTGHAGDITPVPEDTVLKPGEYYVFEQNKNFTFGLGKNDKASLYTAGGVLVDEYSWTSHAAGVYARIPDGTGAFTDYEVSTKGKANAVVNPVVLNEIQSNDPDGGPDWVELANPTEKALDVSGIVVKDAEDTHAYTIPDGTEIPAGGFLVIDSLGFGLGKGDTVRLFDGGQEIAKTTWTDHTNPTWGLYPDVNGKEYRNTSEATPGAANRFVGVPETMEWPGAGETKIYDVQPLFLEDSSGLDFADGKLYAVDNGTGKFWVFHVASDGTLTLADGFENGKRVRFRKDAGNPSAAGPDAEGICVDGNGMVYISSERDNSQKGVNYNSILMVDPNVETQDLTALKEWDLTSSLPAVSANMGIEAVEWVSNAEAEGKLFDQNTGKAFQASDYPDAYSGGVFFTALEDNGHVYAYVLNSDGSAVQIADIDPGLGGAMALDYDTSGHALWVVTDNGYQNMAAKIILNGTEQPSVVYVMPPSGVDVTANNEGFAIATADYTVNGQRPVYRFTDGVSSGALTIGSLMEPAESAVTPEPTAAPDPTVTPEPTEVPVITPTAAPLPSGGAGPTPKETPATQTGTGTGVKVPGSGKDSSVSVPRNTSVLSPAAPATGDSGQISLWLILLTVSAAGILVIFAAARYRKTHRSR